MSDSSSVKVSSIFSLDLVSIGFITWLVFLILKVTGTWNISWFWVWFPFWLPWAISAALFIIVVIITLIIVLIEDL